MGDKEIELLRSKLASGLIHTDILLGGAKLLDEDSCRSPAFLDPKYLPFYYHLGVVYRPTTVTQYGSKLGLVGACLAAGSKGLTAWHARDLGETGPPPNVVKSNLKMRKERQATYGLTIEPGPFVGVVADVAMLSESYDPAVYGACLAALWSSLRPEGLLVADYIHGGGIRGVFTDFCSAKNRVPSLFDTRYGVGVITR